jgi:uncharacterized protein YuzE
MGEYSIQYDEDADTLNIGFVPARSATGLELNENLLLRVDASGRVAVGLTVFNYSLVAQRTEMGPRSFALTGLDALSADLRELALALLLSEPVSDFLAVSAYTPAGNPSATVPITSLVSGGIAARAA